MRAITIVASSIVAAGLLAATIAGCRNEHDAKPEQAGGGGTLGASTNIADLMKQHGLSESDVGAAL